VNKTWVKSLQHLQTRKGLEGVYSFEWNGNVSRTQWKFALKLHRPGMVLFRHTVNSDDECVGKVKLTHAQYWCRSRWFSQQTPCSQYPAALGEVLAHGTDGAEQSNWYATHPTPQRVV